MKLPKIGSFNIINLVFIVIAAMAILQGCNREIFWDLNQKFETAYIDLGQPIGTKVIMVKSWRDYEKSDTVQVVDQDGNVYLTHYSKIVLMKK